MQKPAERERETSVNVTCLWRGLLASYLGRNRSSGHSTFTLKVIYKNTPNPLFLLLSHLPPHPPTDSMPLSTSKQKQAMDDLLLYSEYWNALEN